MTKRSPGAVTKNKLRLELVAAEKQADAAKKAAKLSKLALRNARQKYKDARRASKKLRKIVKALKAEMTAIVTKSPRRRVAAKPRTAAKRALPPVLPAPDVPIIAELEGAQTPLVPEPPAPAT